MLIAVTSADAKPFGGSRNIAQYTKPSKHSKESISESLAGERAFLNTLEPQRMWLMC